MSIEQWNVVAISRLLRFARKNNGPWDDLELWPKDDSRVMPNEDDAALIASAPQLQADRDLLREGHRLIKGFAEHIRDNADNANLVRVRASNIVRWIEINAALQETEG